MGSPVGHRESYVETLSGVTGLARLIKPRGVSTLRTLLAADKVLFATLEDDNAFFFAVAILRAILGRHTVAIFMSPRRCFIQGFINSTVRRHAFRFLKRLRSVTLLSILPFYLDKRFASVADDWIYDPQFWDLDKRIENSDWPDSALAQDLKRKARGRPILLFLGGPSFLKGFPFLAEILRARPAIMDRLMIVVAGKIPEDQRRSAELASEAGGLVIDRYLTDDEVLSAKRCATCLWACYHPSYDSSSGLFGRAMQLGKQVIVRRGSNVDTIASHLKYPVHRCAFDDIEEGAAVLMKIGQGDALPQSSAITLTCRDQSVARLRAALEDRDNEFAEATSGKAEPHR
ncbi:MAG: glycosyltransferase [Mesorhizobium sp.]|nr:MAG: glycosyltransferase [Mesorhizobium sp.]